MSDLQKQFIDYFREIRNCTILDVGCGDRQYEKFIDPSNKYIGLDVEISGRTSNYKQADIFYDGINIPIDNDSVDFIICTQVLEHAVDADGLVKEFYRVLKKGGSAYVTVPFFWGEHEIPFDFRRFTSFGIKKIFENCGFQLLKYEKITKSSDAIKVVLNSEMVNYERLYMCGKRNFIGHLICRIFNIAFKLLDRYYTLERIYLDNLIIVEKQ